MPSPQVLLPPALNLIMPVNWANPIHRGLVAWWMVMPQLHGPNTLIDLTRQNTVVDYSVAGSGSTWPTLVNSNRPAGFGGAYSFDGSADFIATTLTTAFGDFSCCVWFKAPDFVSSWDRIVDKRYNQGFWIGRQNTANSYGGGVRESSPPFGRFVTMPDNEWNHIFSVREGTTHTIYGNGGAVINSGTVAATALSTTAFRFGIDHGESEPAASIIDDVRVWNRAVTADEVQAVYQDSLGG